MFLFYISCHLFFSCSAKLNSRFLWSPLFYIFQLFGLLLAGFLMKNLKILLQEQETNNNAMSVLNSSCEETHLPLENNSYQDLGEESCLNGIETKRFYMGDSPTDTSLYYMVKKEESDLIKQHFYNNRESGPPSYMKTHTDFYPP